MDQVVSHPWIRPYFLGVGIRGVPLDSHDYILPSFTTILFKALSGEAVILALEKAGKRCRTPAI